MAHRSFREEFALAPDLIYLNSGTHSICPRRVTDAVVGYLRECERNPTANLVGIWDKLWEVQKGLGAFLGARPEDLFLRANVTAAMNSFILGMPLPVGPGEILVSDVEYQAVVNICRYRAEQSGLKLRAFHLPGRNAREFDGLTAEALAELVVCELKPDTRMLLLSHVTTGHGLKLPIELIARETRKRGILLAVDGAHATGALPLDFSKLGDLDFYGGNLHKWAMGPKGTGFGWVHPLHQDRLEPREIGWTTFESGDPHNRFAPGSRFAQKHIQAASIDFAPLLGIGEMIAFWREHGADKIRARLSELQACVAREIGNQVGWDWLAPTDPALRGPLLSFELPAKLEAEGYGLMKRVLKNHKLQIASSRLQGRWVMRIAPHIHNTEAEIQQAAKILARL